MTSEIEALRSRVGQDLYEAHVAVRATDPVAETLGVGDVDAAYEVQEVFVQRLEGDGAVRLGRKVGLTNPAVQEQLGVEQPDFGVLLDTMVIDDGSVVDTSELIAPRIEAELAFIMARDVDEVDRDSVVGAVGSVAASFEIVDSRVRDWKITIVDTIADNASSGRFVLGPVRGELGPVVPADVTMTLTKDGETVSTGSGRACLDDPLNALVWVAEMAASLGRPLRAGEVVLSGALGPMVPLEAGHTYQAEITGLGTVTVRAQHGTDR